MHLLVSKRVLRSQVRALIWAQEETLKQKGHSRRINPDRGAMTLITTSGPGGKYTGPIHYDQRRTLTVAERKRLQGVPDDYHLVGCVENVSPA